MDLSDSQVAYDDLDRAPFEFEGTLNRVHLESLPVEQLPLTPPGRMMTVCRSTELGGDSNQALVSCRALFN
jgi:hypothetical protein